MPVVVRWLVCLCFGYLGVGIGLGFCITVVVTELVCRLVVCVQRAIAVAVYIGDDELCVRRRQMNGLCTGFFNSDCWLVLLGGKFFGSSLSNW